MESWKRNYGDNIEMLAFLTRHHRFTDATIAGQPTRVVRTSVRGRHNKERALRTFGKKSAAMTIVRRAASIIAEISQASSRVAMVSPCSTVTPSIRINTESAVILTPDTAPVVRFVESGSSRGRLRDRRKHGSELSCVLIILEHA